jgi:hypothetical protein
MRWLGPAWGRSGRAAGIGLLILSLVHTPLPQPDFHNIRHHDGPGEVCAYHDHLLRWHPTASFAKDVAVLHWHWILPSEPERDPASPGLGSAIHAHAPDWQGAVWDTGPQIARDTSSRLILRLVRSPLDLSLAVVDSGALRLSVGMHPSLLSSASVAPTVSLTSLLQRWVC